ncbi:hypothetical protein PENSTE_c001G08122 [Penicillium steckii]|uniref:FZ domain-containing protein n=1 Tax=Penicillium steckii TaxID=303698 RepID=A0A1V6TZ99_9EURO|nr:hypothetical protein PENSTE_c001G08122 [Penicillium steckii]
MRRQYAFLQYYLTATIIATVLLALSSVTGADATDGQDHGSNVQARSSLGEQDMHGGAGFSAALGSFNGLEMRDNAIENGELDLFRRKYPSNASPMANNEFQDGTISVGSIQHYYIKKEVVNTKSSYKGKGLPPFINPKGQVVSADDWNRDLQKREETNPIFISLTTCSKPHANKTVDAGSFPQLKLWWSDSDKVTEPGPDKDMSNQHVVAASGGYLNVTIFTTNDIYLGVSAGNSSEWSGTYRYQIAASVDEYFHAVHDVNNLLFVDADQTSALLVTNNLTESAKNSSNYHEWITIKPPFTMFAHNINNTALVGLDRSYCALNDLSNLGRISNSTEVGMTARGLGNYPKEQFYLTGLSPGSTYNGILAMEGNGTLPGNGIVGGGGQVYAAMNFTTKKENNCHLMFNLTFCSEVAYAVPSNPDMSKDKLRDLYDDYAHKYWGNFEKSLQQVQCNTSRESMFSLATDCEECAKSYRQWLCSVTIPRCEDFSNNASYLKVRNAGQDFINGTSLPIDSPYRKTQATNVSRNSLIDEKIKPGPYKEVLPCQDICHDLVRNCPAALGFACPEGKYLNDSYGYRDGDGLVTCSYLGAAYFLSAASNLGVWGSLYMLTAMWGVWWTLW